MGKTIKYSMSVCLRCLLTAPAFQLGTIPLVPHCSLLFSQLSCSDDYETNVQNRFLTLSNTGSTNILQSQENSRNIPLLQLTELLAMLRCCDTCLIGRFESLLRLQDTFNILTICSIPYEFLPTFISKIFVIYKEEIISRLNFFSQCCQ